MNPPFSHAKEFGTQLLSEYEDGDVTAAIMLINGYSANTNWFKPFRSYTWCLVTDPVFYKPGVVSTNPMVWAAFVYLGLDFDDFRVTFSELGTVYKDPSEREWQKRWSKNPRTA